MIFTCQSCGETLPPSKRAMSSPIKSPVCKSCWPAVEAIARKKREQKGRR